MKYISEKNEKYVDITNPIRTQPMTTQPNDVITYINTIQKNYNNIRDIPNCKDIYDDNFKVQELGYNKCETAYNDYLEKNLDINNKYGRDKSLADMCPVSTKSREYSECLKSLLHKFTDNATILDNISLDMNSSINKRLEIRSGLLDNIQLSMNSFIYNKEQNDFRNDMLKNKQVPKYPDEILGLVNNYYQDRYKGGIETFESGSSDSSSGSDSIGSDTFIEKTYFGKYKPINGQFNAINDLVFTIEYDSLNEASAILNTNTSSTSSTSSKLQNSVDKTISKNTNKRPILFTISSNDDLYIIYTVVRIELYKLKKNAIKLILTNKRIINQTNENNLIEPLLSMLGINSPSTLIMVFEEYTSTENIKHKSFKLVNDNLDTILVLEKLNDKEITK
jgi:hypothetical protein